MAGILRRDFLRQGLVGLAALVSSYLLLQAESITAEPSIEIKKQETEKPEKKPEEFKVYFAGRYDLKEKEPYTILSRVMFDKNREVEGKLEKVLGELDFKIVPKVIEVTGREYFGKCKKSELLGSWQINGKNYLVGRYLLWRNDKNGTQVGDQYLVVISEKGIFPLLPAKKPTDGIVYTAVVGDDGTILVAELGNQPESMQRMREIVAVYTPDKDGGYSANLKGYIKLPETYKAIDVVRAHSIHGEWKDGLRYIIGSECRILEPLRNPENGRFSMYRFLPFREGGYKDDK